MSSFSLIKALVLLNGVKTHLVSNSGKAKPTFSYSNATETPAADGFRKISFPSSVPVTDEEMHRFADSLGHPRENAVRDDAGFHIRVPV